MAKRYKDLSNQRFGKLIAIERSENRWKCLCDCGNTSNVRAEFLLSGQTSSCGCYRREIMSKRTKGVQPYNIKPEGIARAGCVFREYKKKAKKKKLEFTLTFEDFLELTSRNCYYCDSVPLNKSTTKDPHNGDYIYSGIDRFDNHLGYIESNCVPCCKTCNRSKSDFNIEEFKNWISKIYKHLLEKKS